MPSKEYYDKYLKRENEGICECKNKTRFLNLSLGYSKFCSVKCSRNSEKTKEKQKETCLIKYGAENPNKNKEVREKIKQTNINKYGFKNPFQNVEIKEKIKQTNINKYGVKNPSNSEKIKEKKKITCLKNYGCECSLQSKEIKEKIKQTNINKYGCESGYNKEINLKKIIPKVNEILKQSNLELLSNYNNNREIIKLQCKICNNIFESNYFNIQQGYGKCPVCFPRNKSSGEIELLNL